MKIKKLIVFLGFILLLYLNVIFAEENSEIKESRRIERLVIAWMKKNNIPGAAIEIYADGQPHSYYFGLADKDKKIPITHHTIFELGSFTKLFTNLLLAEEVAAGKMVLDDSIVDYVPDLAILSDYLPKVSVFNLATHTSGLPFHMASEIRSRSQLPEFFSNWVPSSSIGTFWEYSNINTGLLGYVLEASTHETINQLYRTRLLHPLDMQLIGIEVPKDLTKNYAQGYTEEDQVKKHDNQWLFPAAGAMKASGEDMLRFLRAALQLPGVPVRISYAMRMTQTAYVKTDKMFQGLGWTIYPIRQDTIQELMHPELQSSFKSSKAKTLDKLQQKFDENVLIDKTGATEGFRSYIALIPARKSGVVILVNRYIPNGEIIKIGREILFGINSDSRVGL